MPAQEKPVSTETTTTTPTTTDESKPAPVSPRLTPSEIESLRKHGKLVLTSLDGKFDHLFKK